MRAGHYRCDTFPNEAVQRLFSYELHCRWSMLHPYEEMPEEFWKWGEYWRCWGWGTVLICWIGYEEMVTRGLGWKDDVTVLGEERAPDVLWEREFDVDGERTRLG